MFADFSPNVRRALPRLVGYRFISNIGVRYAYTFLPAIARGSGLSIEQMSRLLSIRDLSGCLAPAAGRAADRGGSGKLMAVASVMGVVSMALACLGRPGLAIGFVLFGISKIGFDVSMNSWIGDHVPYARRGRAMGLVELSWAASALLGLPTLGLLIQHVGWNAASAALALVGAPIAIAIARSEGRQPSSTKGQAVHRTPRFDGGVAATIAAFCLMTTASQLLIIGHGLWLEDTYALSTAGVGFAVIAIGVVEAMGSSTSSWLTDRLGKRRAVTLGTMLMGVAVTTLSMLPSPRLLIGLLVLAIAFLGFEFALVSALPLISELDPGARAQMLGWALGLSTVLRAVGSVGGGWIYVHHGFDTLMGTAALSCVASIVMLLTVVPEPQRPHSEPIERDHVVA